jgi:hypothetical protein
MANTVIQLKYSDATATPTTLTSGEAAYSNNSNKLFIGLSDNSVVAIGGKYYTDIIDAATDANTNYTLVKRDSLGMFSATAVKASLFGNANSATVLQNARNFGLTGPDITSSNIGFDGSSAITLQANLSNTGVTAGTYGGQTQIPTFAVDAKGRITSAANVAISTTLAFAGDNGTGNLTLLSDTFTITGGVGIDSFAYDANNTVVLSVDNTVIRTTGNQTITGNTTIQGNLYVTGNTFTVGVTNLDVTDSIINLANGNFFSDTLDIGLAGSYNNGVNAHVGFFRDAETKEWYAFEGYVPDITANSINVADATFATSNINASYFKGNVISRGVDVQTFAAAGYTQANTALTVGSAAYGKANIANSIAQAAYDFANTLSGGSSTDGYARQTANAAFAQANAAYDRANTDVTSITVSSGDYGAPSMVPVFHLEANGRISSISNTSIAIGASAITSGTLPIARGGTNNNTFTANQLVNYDGTKLASLANASYTLSGAFSTSNTITSLTVDGYGRVTAATGDIIAIAASQITSGTLGVVRGGTGASSFTVKGVIVSDNSSSTGALSSLTSSTEGHILTINASGVPTFAYLTGGSF